MSPNKTLYIRDVDVPIWDRAEKAATRVRQPISQLVTGLLRAHLSQLDVADDEITVGMRDKDGHEWTEAFRGRWLIEPDDGNLFGSDAGTCYGIALTALGKIAVYRYHVNDRWLPALEVFNNLDEAQDELELKDEPIAAAAAAIGQRRVIRRDI